MKRNLLTIALCFAGIATASAQESFEEYKARLQKEYSTFESEETRKFEEFRKKCNDEYSAMVKKAWEQMRALKGLPAPKDDKPVPPKVFPENDRKKPIKDNTLPIVTVVPEVKPQPQPQPIVPIEVPPTPVEQYTEHEFSYNGTAMKVRVSPSASFSLNGCSESAVASAWKSLSAGNFDAMLNDCLSLRTEHKYGDWAYLMMLRSLSSSLYGSGTNKAVLMTAYLYCQSGYKMRLATADNHLFMLYASHHTIYDKNYWTIDGERYYPLDCKYNQVKICQATFPKEKPLSLYINTRQVFDRNPSNVRTLQSKRYPNVKATVRTNKNLIKFYDSYPTSCINEDFGTRWAMYANTPMDSESEQTLYPALRAAIKGLSEKEAVERLLNFVQTAFVYEYDDKVWGQDRAFFAEETLNYPYCDCEDRSILFSRLVRDLVGLDVALIYYPGHLATAVRFTETVKGDNVYANGKRYVICDPTYIGAPVGMTMPNMDNSQAKVILL